MKSRRTAARRSTVAEFVEPVERRLLFAFTGEPNNDFDHASYDSNNVYLEQNATITNSVSSSDTDDYYKFYNLYGASHLYAAMGGMTQDADLYVYNQNKVLVGYSVNSSNASETINVDLPANQYFYVRVKYNFANTNYTLNLYNDFAGSTLATARDQGVSWGQTSSKYYAYGQIFVGDYLDYRDNVDLFKFQMEANGHVNLRRLNPVTTAGLPLTTDLVLYNSSGSVIANGSVNGDGLDITGVPLAKGTYYVGVHQKQGSGTYGLRIVSDYAGGTTDSTSVRDLGNVTNTSREMTDMVGGTFGIPAYEDSIDLYKIKLDGSAGHTTSPLALYLDMNGQSTANFDADLFIGQDKNNNGYIETSEKINQSLNLGNDAITYNGLPAGTYYVGVVPHYQKAYTTYRLDIDSDVDGTGDYRGLSLAQSFGTISATTTKTFAGGFGVTGQDISDYYKFTLAGQTTVSSSVTRDANNSRETWTPGVQFIKDSNGNFLYDGLSERLGGGTGSFSMSLPAGTYYLDLSSSGGQLAYTGSITFTPAAPVADPDDTITKVKTSTKNVVATGGSVQFGLDNSKDVDLIRYVATAGQTIGFDIDGRNGTSPDTYLRLFNSSGTVLASNDNGFATGESGALVSSYLKYTFTTSGTYYLGISVHGNTAYSANTGSGDTAGTGALGDYTLYATRLAKITGNVFADTDKDGVKDSTEKGIAGVTIYLDYDNDGKKDTDEYTALTDSSGNYAFYVAAGTYKFRQVLPSGYTQSLPTGNAGISVTVTAGQSVSGKNFGDKK